MLAIPIGILPGHQDRGVKTRPASGRPILCRLTLSFRHRLGVTRIVTLYMVIKSFRHRGRHGEILPHRIESGHLHPLTGKLKDHWAVWVSGNWRLTFRFDGEDVILVDYQDYH